MKERSLTDKTQGKLYQTRLHKGGLNVCQYVSSVTFNLDANMQKRVKQRSAAHEEPICKSVHFFPHPSADKLHPAAVHQHQLTSFSSSSWFPLYKSCSGEVVISIVTVQRITQSPDCSTEEEEEEEEEGGRKHTHTHRTIRQRQRDSISSTHGAVHSSLLSNLARRAQSKHERLQRAEESTRRSLTVEALGKHAVPGGKRHS